MDPPSELFKYNFSISGRGIRRAVAWRGSCVAVVIEVPGDTDSSNSANCARNVLTIDADVRTRVLRAFDSVYSTMECLTLTDALQAHNGGYCGMAAIETPLDNNGAAGLAHHGVAGISVGVTMLWPLCARAAAARAGAATLVDHVFFYEFGRNFWESRFNRAFDWYCDEKPSCWGWWTVAFNNLWPIILPDVAEGIDLTYYGQARLQFRTGMMRDIYSYVRLASEGMHDFEAWKCSRMPWRKEQSVNNLMTGLLVALYDAYGQLEWIVAFFRELRCAKEVNPGTAGGCEYAKARDNFYIIASKAAERDLVHVFQDQLKWSLSEDARQEIDRLFPDAKPTDPLLPQ